MSTLTRRESRGTLSDLLDWLESPFAAFRPFSAQPLRMEDYVKDGRYTVRAELPGVDPEKHVEVTVSRGILTITADRQEETEGKHHSEFRYGVFTRQITLPEGADDEHVQASYDKGILEVSVPLRQTADKEAKRHIPVRVVGHIKPS
ncbi:MAG: Hsp20/alpha crystallin family protein [Streptosporangiaceae bacterium]